VAGKVLEVKGGVQIKRGAETKPLAVGDTVEATDIVVTGADGNVVIELAHNSARWELGPNKEQKVSESIAWKAKKATAEEIDQATAAAGRPAERNAAGTVATADEGAAPEAEAAPAAAEAAMAPPPPAAAKAEDDFSPKGGAPPPERPRRRATASAPKAAAAPPPPPPPEVASSDEAPAPRTRRGAIQKKSAEVEVASAESARAPSSDAVAAPHAPPAPGGGAPPKVMARTVDPVAAANGALGAKSSALQKCLADSGAKEAVTISVTIANGKPSVKLSSKAAISAGLDKCLKGVVNGVSFSGNATVTKVVKP
jgi:hypothetical protein